MKIQNWTPPDSKALGPDVPQWFRRFTEPLHTHLRLLTTALQGSLTPSENENADLVTFDADHDTTQRVSHGVRGVALGAILVSSGTYDYADLAWQPVSEGVADVKVKWATDPGEPTEVRILFFAL